MQPIINLLFGDIFIVCISEETMSEVHPPPGTYLATLSNRNGGHTQDQPVDWYQSRFFIIHKLTISEMMFILIMRTWAE